MRVYQGKRDGFAVDVTVNGRPLNPRLDLWNHSPSGFEWGYCGSGPAQLALALLADCLDNPVDATAWHQQFKFSVVAGLPYAGWTLTDEAIRGTITTLINE